MWKSIDILIGVSVVMLAVSMSVTLITHIVTTLANSRGRHLLRGLTDILQQLDPALRKGIAETISRQALTHPLVSDVSRRLGTVIHREEFTKILLDFAADNGPQKLEEDARDALVGAMQNNGLKDPKATLENIRALAVKLEQSNPELANAARLNLAILHEAGSQFVAKINGWFDQTIDRVSSRFTASTRIITCTVALLMAFAVQLDTIALLNRLWTDPSLRQELVKEARAMETTPPNDKPQSQTDAVGKVDAALGTTGLISRPKWEWYKASSAIRYPVWPGFTFQKLLGVLLSAALLSLGAPFWYNVLKTSLRLRSSIAEKDDSQREERQTTQQPPPQADAASQGATTAARGALAGEQGDVGAVG